MAVVSEYIDVGLRFSVAYFVMVVLYVLNMSFLSFPLSLSLEPPFILMTIYYWSIYRPKLIPVWLVFIAGILFDFISNMPIGLHGLIFVATRWLVTDQRLLLSSQSYIAIWIGFVVVNLIAVIVEWVLFGLIRLEWPPYEPAALIFASGVLLFPFVSLILHLTHKVLPELSDQYRVVK